MPASIQTCKELAVQQHVQARNLHGSDLKALNIYIPTIYSECIRRFGDSAVAITSSGLLAVTATRLVLSGLSKWSHDMESTYICSFHGSGNISELCKEEKRWDKGCSPELRLNKLLALKRSAISANYTIVLWCMWCMHLQSMILHGKCARELWRLRMHDKSERRLINTEHIWCVLCLFLSCAACSFPLIKEFSFSSDTIQCVRVRVHAWVMNQSCFGLRGSYWTWSQFEFKKYTQTESCPDACMRSNVWHALKCCLQSCFCPSITAKVAKLKFWVLAVSRNTHYTTKKLEFLSATAHATDLNRDSKSGHKKIWASTALHHHEALAREQT